MNGVHDMGGMHGMGPIEPEPNQPVFHEPWEGRVFALFTRGMGPWGRGRNWGSFRFELESIPAAEYLRMSYYERWFTMLVSRLLRSNLEVTPRFRPEQRVRARNMHPRGHTRLPRYTRGKSGTVVRVHGVFDLQDTDVNGHRFGYRPQHVYTVRFAARELWGDRASARDAVYVDLWETYLEPA